MLVAPISAASLGQYVLEAGTSTQQQALRNLQNSLASGNLSGATSAFQALQNVLQTSAISTGATSDSNSQLSSDVTALGSALSSVDLSAAQSAFAKVQGDLKGSASAAQTNEAMAASQSEQLIAGLLSTLNANVSANTSSSVGNTSAILRSWYGSQSGLNVYA
jgi:hypothetical protein